jgi:hypothetical protein
MTTSLVTEVIIHDINSMTRMRDMPFRVEQMPRGFVHLDFTGSDKAVTIRLNQAEVISLIEALGGRVS